MRPRYSMGIRLFCLSPGNPWEGVIDFRRAGKSLSWACLENFQMCIALKDKGSRHEKRRVGTEGQRSLSWAVSSPLELSQSTGEPGGDAWSFCLVSAPSWMLRPGSCPHGKSIPGKGRDDGYAAQIINEEHVKYWNQTGSGGKRWARNWTVWKASETRPLRWDDRKNSQHLKENHQELLCSLEMTFVSSQRPRLHLLFLFSGYELARK